MPDAILKSGTPGPTAVGTAGVAALIDALYGALRTSVRPLDYTAAGTGRVLGHYSIGMTSGAVTGVASGGILWSLQWADSASLFVLERIRVGAAITTGFTAGQAVDVDAIVARGFSTPDTGGTSFTPIAGFQKMRTSMGNSLVNDLRISTTAALAGGGTKTNDFAPFVSAPIPLGQSPTVANVGIASTVTLYECTALGQHPVVLAKNEGLNLRVVTAMGAGGVVKYYVSLDWAEVAGY
jgi:hypothetical protein